MKPFISDRLPHHTNEMHIETFNIGEQLIYVQFEIPTTQDLCTVFYVVPHPQKPSAAFVATNWENIFNSVAHLEAKEKWEKLLDISPIFSLLISNTADQNLDDCILVKFPDFAEESIPKWCVTMPLNDVHFNHIDGYLNEQTLPLFKRTLGLSLMLFVELLENEIGLDEAKRRGLTGGGVMPTGVEGFGLEALAVAFNVDPAKLQYLKYQDDLL